MAIFPIAQMPAHVVPIFHLGLEVAEQSPGQADGQIGRFGSRDIQKIGSHGLTMAPGEQTGKRRLDRAGAIKSVGHKQRQSSAALLREVAIDDLVAPGPRSLPVFGNGGLGNSTASFWW